MKPPMGQVKVGPAGLEEARKRFHDQDERFNDSRGVPVRTTWAIGPIPYSTTPLQLTDALWIWSGGVGAPWKDIPLRVLQSKGDRGVGQTWLLGAEGSPLALELTLPSGIHPCRNDGSKESKNRCLGQSQDAEGPTPRRNSKCRPVAGQICSVDDTNDAEEPVAKLERHWSQ